MNEDRVTGWWIFAGILLFIGGILNIIWGIAAIGESHFFVGNYHFIISELKTWGWITLIIGVSELVAGFSLFAGGEFGRWIGIIAAAMSSFFAVAPEPATACSATLLLVAFLSIIPVGLIWARFEHVSLRAVAAESEHEAEETTEDKPAPNNAQQ